MSSAHALQLPSLFAPLQMLSAGDAANIQYNVIPTRAVAGFDVRIPCTVDLAAFKAQMDSWCDLPGVTWELVKGTGDRCLDHSVSAIDEDAAWWRRFKEAAAAADAPLHEPSVFPGKTLRFRAQLLLAHFPRRTRDFLPSFVTTLPCPVRFDLQPPQTVVGFD